MSVQMNFLGGQSSSVITGQVVSSSSEGTSGTVSSSISFKKSGSQSFTENGSETVVGNWVNPAYAAGDWEIRATLVSGVTPDTGTLATWQDFSVDRTWGVSRSTVGLSECVLTFEFRKVGESDPETTLEANSLSALKTLLFESD